MGDHQKFLLKVTGGHSYDPSAHTLVEVNSSKPLHISSPHIDASVHVRIQNYRGLPKGSPSTSPYFSHAKHKWDLYSIGFTFRLKDEGGLKGDQVVFGNDFDKPIRDRLPPGFGTALRIAKWTIDPGLDGDPYADEPYLYGPLLSSINVFRIGEEDQDVQALNKSGETKVEAEGHEEVIVFEEGAESDEGKKLREEAGIPSDANARKRHFLTEDHRKQFTFEQGRTYACDFFNGYLDFNEFALKLPGFTLPIIKYWDGQPLR